MGDLAIDADTQGICKRIQVTLELEGHHDWDTWDILAVVVKQQRANNGASYAVITVGDLEQAEAGQLTAN